MRLLLLPLAMTFLALQAHAADEFETPTCAHVDTRAKLAKIGWPRAPHQGGREDALSLAVAEALSLKLGAALSPLDFDRTLQSGVTPETATDEIMKKGPCPISEGPPDDVAFSRGLTKSTRKIAVPKTGCEAHPNRRLKPSSNAFVKIDSTLARVDRALDEDSLPAIFWETPAGRIYSTIEGRRFSAKGDSCEWLVRTMNGPFCDKNLEGICEDGAVWIPRETVAKSLKAAWEAR